jgi:hypothetical protein
MTALPPKYNSHRLRVYENRMLEKIHEPTKDETIRERRKLHNEQLHNSYSSPNITGTIKSEEMGWEYSTHGEESNVYRVLVGKPKESNH